MALYFMYLNNFIYIYIYIYILFFCQARLRLAEVVEKEDVNEAMRLMEMSKDSLNPSVEHGRFVISVICHHSVTSVNKL